MIYLAAPYNDESSHIRLYRYNVATKVAAILCSKGFHVFSPLTHSHPIALAMPKGSNALGWDYWKDFDLKMLGVCSELYILCIDGWGKSIGVQNEIAEAISLGLSITYINEAGEVLVLPT